MEVLTENFFFYASFNRKRQAAVFNVQSIDCTLKTADCLFLLKLALNFKYFERLWYYPLHYAYKTEIEKFAATFFG